MTTVTFWRGMLSALFVSAVLACRQDSPPPLPLPKPAKAPRPAPLDSMVAAARSRILADTASPANRELNLMSAPINTRAVSEVAADSLLLTMPSDSCALLVVSRHRDASGDAPDNDTFFAAEWYGNGGFGLVSDIAPDPDWTWMAYGHRAHSIGAAGRSDAIHDGNPIPVIEHLIDPCAGEECELETVSKVPVAWRVAWTADGVALFAGRELPPQWRAVEPQTREPTDRVSNAPVAIPWAARAVSELAESGSDLRTPGGAYVFSARHDSIMVSGPDQSGTIVSRFVGRGVPVVATRNGEYLLAVRRNAHGLEPIVYYFVLFHAMFHSTCDR